MNTDARKNKKVSAEENKSVNDIEQNLQTEMSDEDILNVAKDILGKYINAFKELAK